jgi:hypothetical protein
MDLTISGLTITVIVVDVDDRQAQRHADSRGAASRRPGDFLRLDHVVDQLLDRAIDLTDALGLLAQNGMADDDNGADHAGSMSLPRSPVIRRVNRGLEPAGSTHRLQQRGNRRPARADAFFHQEPSYARSAVTGIREVQIGGAPAGLARSRCQAGNVGGLIRDTSGRPMATRSAAAADAWSRPRRASASAANTSPPAWWRRGRPPRPGVAWDRRRG